MDEWDVKLTHPSWCDCNCCKTASNPIWQLCALIGYRRRYNEAIKQEKEAKEQEKLEKARQAAANHKDAKQYAEFLAVERNHKAEIRKQKAKAYQNQYYNYVVLAGIPAIISVILLVLNFLASLIFGYNPILFSAILILILILSLLWVFSGVRGLIEVKNKL